MEGAFLKVSLEEVSTQKKKLLLLLVPERCTVHGAYLSYSSLNFLPLGNWLLLFRKRKHVLKFSFKHTVRFKKKGIIFYKKK
jgi:hypothetical protein